MDKRDICNSKVRYISEMAVVEYLEFENKMNAQSYYKCKVCKGFHTFTINEKLNHKKRNQEIKKQAKERLIREKRKKGRNRRKGD